MIGYHSIHIELISIKMDAMISILGCESAKNDQAALTENVLEKAFQTAMF